MTFYEGHLFPFSFYMYHEDCHPVLWGQGSRVLWGQRHTELPGSQRPQSSSALLTPFALPPFSVFPPSILPCAILHDRLSEERSK